MLLVLLHYILRLTERSLIRVHILELMYSIGNHSAGFPRVYSSLTGRSNFFKPGGKLIHLDHFSFGHTVETDLKVIKQSQL